MLLIKNKTYMPNQAEKESIAYLIPAFNEGAVIEPTILSLLKITSKDNIYLVDDGSSDQTLLIAMSYLVNVTTIPNGGKANAINRGIEIFDLTNKYKYIMPVDADTLIPENLAEVVTPIFESDNNKKIAAVICKVRGRTTNVLTTFRMWEYEISQIIHKSAQEITNSIIVCPGCSTVYRSEVFNKIKFPSRTLTEDMDLTFTIHRKNLGKIAFSHNAEVTTQDPKNLKEYIKQMHRWYTGFWMCVNIHKVPFGGQMLDAEVAMLAIEGVFNGLLSLFVLIGLPFALLSNPAVFFYPLAFDLIFFTLPTVIYMVVKYNSPKIFLYIPAFYCLRLFNSIVFFTSFIKATLGAHSKKDFTWDTARYTYRKEGKWAIQPLE